MKQHTVALNSAVYNTVLFVRLTDMQHSCRTFRDGIWVGRFPPLASNAELQMRPEIDAGIVAFYYQPLIRIVFPKAQIHIIRYQFNPSLPIHRHDAGNHATAFAF